MGDKSRGNEATWSAQGAFRGGAPDATEGNYVDFGTNPDGLYVVRVATDASNTIAELVEDDNHGYAYIRVTGDHIDVLERGYGLSPWDPAKIVADDTRNPTV